MVFKGFRLAGFQDDVNVALSQRPALTVGSRGQAVQGLQILINRMFAALGQRPIKVDGIFGSETAGAVKLIEDNVLLATPARPGVVGPEHWAALANYKLAADPVATQTVTVSPEGTVLAIQDSAGNFLNQAGQVAQKPQTWMIAGGVLALGLGLWFVLRKPKARAAVAA